jgi:hypothetical protein
MSQEFLDRSTSSGYLTPEYCQLVSPTATVVLMVAAVLPVPKMKREWMDFNFAVL